MSFGLQSSNNNALLWFLRTGRKPFFLCPAHDLFIQEEQHFHICPTAESLRFVVVAKRLIISLKQTCFILTEHLKSPKLRGIPILCPFLWWGFPLHCSQHITAWSTQWHKEEVKHHGLFLYNIATTAKDLISPKQAFPLAWNSFSHHNFPALTQKSKCWPMLKVWQKTLGQMFSYFVLLPPEM